MEKKQFYYNIIYSIFQTRTDLLSSINDYLEATAIKIILKEAKSLLFEEPILLELSGDFIVVGDLHGNIDDLLRIFGKCGYPPTTRYLFLGDYVDRGKNGLEVILLLLTLKLLYNEHIFLLRGNHETPSINRAYGFYSEIISKYDEKIYNSLNKTFAQFPIAAILNKKIFCVHGGISPELKSLDVLRKSEKVYDISGPSLFTDLLWSDPTSKVTDFASSLRGSGYFFGEKALAEFLDNNDILLLLRSHEFCQEGINWPIETTNQVITIFSNSDYCGKQNTSAVLKVVAKNDQFIVVKFQPLSKLDKKKYRVIYPQWICDYIAKESCSISSDEEFPSSPDIEHISKNELH